MPDELTSLIAKDLGISDLPANEQQALIEQFGSVALQAATLAIVGKLPQEKRDEFGKLAQAGDPMAIKNFLDRELLGHNDIAQAAVAEEVKKFKAFQAP